MNTTEKQNYNNFELDVNKLAFYSLANSKVVGSIPGKTWINLSNWTKVSGKCKKVNT